MPTITSTPQPTFTPTPTAILPGVYVLPNHSYYIDILNSFWGVGEVWNNTSEYLRFVKIYINLFGDSGQLLASDYSYTYLENIPPGEKTCFEALIWDTPQDWSYYEFEGPYYWTDGEPLPDLTVINDSSSYDPLLGWYSIVGQVRNDHGSRVEFVSPVGTLYDAIGTVIGCNFTYVQSTHLDPEQVSAFEVLFLGRDYFDVTSYRLQVGGNP